MIIFSIATVLYSIMCCLIVILVLVQRGKGNMGLGSMGGGNQMLFGSSGGQDIFQKATWILCAFLLLGSLSLSVLKGKYGKSYSSVTYSKNIATTSNEEVVDQADEDIELEA